MVRTSSATNEKRHHTHAVPPPLRDEQRTLSKASDPPAKLSSHIQFRTKPEEPPAATRMSSDAVPTPLRDGQRTLSKALGPPAKQGSHTSRRVYFKPEATRNCLAIRDCTAQLITLYALTDSVVCISRGRSSTCLRSHCRASPPSRPPHSTTNAVSCSPWYLTCLSLYLIHI